MGKTIRNKTGSLEIKESLLLYFRHAILPGSAHTEEAGSHHQRGTGVVQ